MDRSFFLQSFVLMKKKSIWKSFFDINHIFSMPVCTLKMQKQWVLCSHIILQKTWRLVNWVKITIWTSSIFFMNMWQLLIIPGSNVPYVHQAYLLVQLDYGKQIVCSYMSAAVYCFAVFFHYTRLILQMLIVFFTLKGNLIGGFFLYQ
jgi:hypothetical protein